MPKETTIMEARNMTHQKQLPFRTMKIFGVVQIGLGILCICLNIIGVILIQIDFNKVTCDNCDSRRFDIKYVFTLTLPCVFLPIWFIITGVIPLIMSEARVTSFRCQKIGFMVCCIISAAAIVPTLFTFALAAATQASYYGVSTRVISILTSLIAIAEFVIAIVASSFCCCCSPWGPDITEVVVVQSQPGTFVSLQQCQQSVVQGPVVTGVPQSQVNAGMHNNSQQALQINFQKDDYRY